MMSVTMWVTMGNNNRESVNAHVTCAKMLQLCCCKEGLGHKTSTHQSIFYVTFIFFPITITSLNNVKRV